MPGNKVRHGFIDAEIIPMSFKIFAVRLAEKKKMFLSHIHRT